MYNSSEAKKATGEESKYLSGGIQDNCTLISVKNDVSPIKGNHFIEFTFGKDDKIVQKTEWEPTKFNGMSDKDVKDKQDRQFGRILQILSCFYADSELDFSCDSFEELTTWVYDKLNVKIADNKLLKVKVVYDDKGYATLPSYAKYTFIEPMELAEGEVSKIEKLGIDRFVRPEITADKEDKVDPLAKTTNSATTVTTKSALPF